MISIHLFVNSPELSVSEHKNFTALRIVNGQEDLTLFFDDIEALKKFQKELNSAIKKKKEVE